MASIAASSAAWVAGLVAIETGFWLAVALLCPLFLAASLWGVAHYRQRDYMVAASLAFLGLYVWLFTIAWHSRGLASGVLVAVEAALCGLVLVLAQLTVQLLLPSTTMWINVKPKTDAAGQLMFEE